MKSLEYAVVGTIAGAAVAVVVNPPGGLPLLVVGAVFMSIFIGPGHSVITRAQHGDQASLWLMATNPRVGLLGQEQVFRKFGTEFDRKHPLSHHPVGGVAVGAFAFSGLGSLTASLAVVLYVHVVCDFLRDLGTA